jgi:hypothetical protein
MRSSPAVSLASWLVLTACSPRGAEAVRQAEGITAESRIQFVDPWFRLAPGKKTSSIAISIDGRAVGRCSMRDPSQEEVCTEAIVEPGSHTIRFVMDYLDEETLSIFHQDYFHTELRLTVGAAQDIRVVLSRMEADDESEYVVRRKAKGALPRCVKQIFEAASAATCSADELEAMRSEVSKAVRVCGSIDERHVWQADAALADLERNLAGLELERCVPHTQLGRVPHMVAAQQAHWSWWPKGTVEVGSWRWARAVTPVRSQWERRREPKPTVRDRLRMLEQQLPTMIERVGMLDEVLAGYLVGRRPDAAMQSALQAEYDLDPRTVQGHRLHLLMASGLERAEWLDGRLAAFLTTRLTADREAHCANVGAARAVAYLVRDEHLSADEWRAVQAMASRTPADQRIDDACRSTLRGDLRSDVPLLERLRWFSEFDCSSARHMALRAEAVRAFVTDSGNRVDTATRKRVHEEFIACLGSDGG